jgi:hypothetical protein
MLFDAAERPNPITTQTFEVNIVGTLDVFKDNGWLTGTPTFHLKDQFLPRRGVCVRRVLTRKAPGWVLGDWKRQEFFLYGVVRVLLGNMARVYTIGNHAVFLYLGDKLFI